MGRAVVADFETTTLADDCRVWAWGLGDIDTETYETDGVDIESFLYYMSSSEFTCYFHNLAYDGSFIVDWLLRKEFHHVTDVNLSHGSSLPLYRAKVNGIALGFVGLMVT